MFVQITQSFFQSFHIRFFDTVYLNDLAEQISNQ